MVDITEQKRAEQALRDSEEELRRLSTRLLHVQEDERKRIARELHDSIGQSLAAIKFVAENALSRIRQGEHSPGVSVLESLIPLVQQAGDEVRRIHTDLRPSLLDDLGIVSTISWFCREFGKLYEGIHIEKTVEIEEWAVPEPLKIVIFRVMQEALNNVAKHGGATRAVVTLRQKDGNIDLAVQDDGHGFNMTDIIKKKKLSRGFGLTNMKERTELSGGTFTVDSRPGRGTVIRATWPIGEKIAHI
jgi:signal transduction histidine kinase